MTSSARGGFVVRGSTARCASQPELRVWLALGHCLDTPLPCTQHFTMRSPLSRVRKLCLGLPEAHEVEAWGEPTFRVRNKLFAMYASSGNHHGAGRPAIWMKAPPGNQDIMVRANPERFFVPPYVGPSGWIGVHLDGDINWEELDMLLRDSYRLVAPKRLAARLEDDE